MSGNFGHDLPDFRGIVPQSEVEFVIKGNTLLLKIADAEGVVENG